MSALLSASETSLTASSRPRIHHLHKSGDARAKAVATLQQKLDAVVSASIMGNTSVNILISSLLTVVCVVLVGEVGVIYAAILSTSLVLLFAEVMPKLFAVRYPERTALWLSPFLLKFMVIAEPPTRFVQALSRKIWSLMGYNLASESDLTAQEESLRGAIDLHRGHHPEVEEERRMLKSILDLDDIVVEEILVHRKDVVTLNVDAPINALVDAIFTNPYTRYPVWQDNPENIIGLLHARDVLKALRYDTPGPHSQEVPGVDVTFDIRKVLIKPWFIHEATSLFDQLQAFRKRHEHMAMVIDEYGAFLGIVTLEDILEEIVGEITDEHDPKNQLATPLEDDSFEVKGHTTLRDLNRHFEWGLPDDHATTVAGLVLYQCKRIPRIGQTITLGGFKFHILERQRNQITKIKITPPRDS